MIKSKIILNKNFILHHQTRQKRLFDILDITFVLDIIDIDDNVIEVIVVIANVIK